MISLLVCFSSENKNSDISFIFILTFAVTLAPFIMLAYFGYNEQFFSMNNTFIGNTLLIEDSQYLHGSIGKDKQTIYINVKNETLKENNKNEPYQKMSNATNYGYATIAKINPYTQTIEPCNDYGNSFVEMLKEAYNSDNPNNYRIISNQESTNLILEKK